jgi:peptide/nickel transport system permease protein
MASKGESIDQQTLEGWRIQYGLGEPVIIQYLKWMRGIAQGNFGMSFYWNQPVSKLIWERLGLTFVLSLFTLLFTWIVGFAIGIYSAVKQYSLGDYIFTFLGFIGLAIPGFLLALILMYVSFKYLGFTAGGLFSSQFVEAPWNMAKALDMLRHIWIPVVILGASGAASLIRVMRANLLDELNKPYVVTARAKGLAEGQLLMEYPVRVALNPFVSTVGWSLPALVSGETIVAVVLGLPTSGPLLLNALLQQDMYLAGAFILLLSTLTVIGTLVSDILLAWLDPRIRYQ